MVPCGRCLACRMNKARSWGVRIMHEVKSSDASCFVTLTYSDENLPKDGSLSVEHCQKFLKRLRKNVGVKVRYFLGGEYGEKRDRPHYHVIFFGLGPESRVEIDKAWGLGHVWIGHVTVDSANYVAGYTLKKLSGERVAEYKGRKPEFGLMSRRPGIGHDYLDRFGGFLKNNGFCVVKGNKVAMPRYYSERVFVTEDEKRELHEKRQKVINEAFASSRCKSGIGDDGPAYLVSDYNRTEREAQEALLKSRQDLNRRKL